MKTALARIKAHCKKDAHHDEAMAFSEVDWYIKEYLLCPKSDLHDSALELRGILDDLIKSWGFVPTPIEDVAAEKLGILLADLVDKDTESKFYVEYDVKRDEHDYKTFKLKDAENTGEIHKWLESVIERNNNGKSHSQNS